MVSPVRAYGKRRSADIGRVVRRFISAIAFVAALLIVLGAAGCGQRFEREPGNAPASADLAADALAALEDAGSAHFVVDLRSGSADSQVPFQISLHFEGDASKDALDAEGSVSFGAGSLRGRVLVGEHDLFVQFMDQWYGEHQGLVEVLKEAKTDRDGGVWAELATPEGLRRNFDQLFDGEVKEGPAVEGGPTTWQFEGRLDPEGVIEFAKRFDAQPTDREEEMFAKVAEATKFLLVVGQDDQLPRRLEVSVNLSAEDLKEMQASGVSRFDGAENFTATLELSEFGKQVEIHPPADFKPLDALFEQLFSGFG
jgi:hypothetical protein